ncbi:energy-coupling factor transporter transmembrane component T family protein [Photobacterium alginatilyticum]|uniref:energy-coupling factor transporter transmembrane component T family protein n=1 Tax=Photobacterium alginatilyticum TaxID=1775171 RepID=UPI0040697136
MIDALLATSSTQMSSVNAAPRVRLLLAIVIAAAVVMNKQWAPLFGYGLLAFHLWQHSLVGLCSGLKRLAAVDGFIVFTVILLPFTEPGEVAFHVGEMAVTREGMTLAAMILLKANILVITLMAQCAGLNAMSLSYTLAELKIPHKLVLIMQLSIRYISVMQLEFKRLHQAMKARGFQPDSSLHTWRSYGYLFGMMLVRALDRADRIWLAMKCRGFNGRFPQTPPVPLSARDKRYLGGYLIIVVLIFHGDIAVSWLVSILPIQEWS